MADRILTLEQLLAELEKYTYKELHVHHTWKPDHSNWRSEPDGLYWNQSMRNYHVNTRGWQDIGQHVTLLPDGKFVTGRDFGKTPASIQGYNTGAFAVEMLGNFDIGNDKFEGPQKESMIKLARYFYNKGCYIRFHRENAAKTCPGTSIDKNEFMKEVMGMAENIVKTPILGRPMVTLEQARAWAQKRGAHQRFIDVAEYYWYYGELTGIRPEVLYVQAAKETNFGKFTGNVKPEQNNWAGIKVANPKGDRTEDHETFGSPKDGVRCHFNHMSIYCGVEPIGPPHPRYSVTEAVAKRDGWLGKVKYVEDLGGKWAPNSDYGKSIVRDYLNGLLGIKNEQSPPKEKGESKMPNEYIIAIQAALKQHGIDPGPVDGIVGPKTLAGVREAVNRMTLAEREWNKLKNTSNDARLDKAKELAKKILEV